MIPADTVFPSGLPCDGTSHPLPLKTSTASAMATDSLKLSQQRKDPTVFVGTDPSSQLHRELLAR